MELISIIIPSFNRSRTLEKTVYSALRQDYQKIELIIIDDGSTDGTAQLLEQLKNEDARIRYFSHSRNLGAQAARNTGILNSHGEWIAFLDSDDIWQQNSLSLRINLARQKATPIVHSDGNVLRVEGDRPKLIGVRPLSGMVHKDLLKAPGPLYPTILARKSAFVRIGGLDTSILAYQEWDTSLRLAKYYPFGFVEEPTFTYNCCGNDTISSNLKRDADGYRQIVRKHFKDILKNLGPKAIARHYLFIGRRYKMANHKFASVCYKLLSLIWWPRFNIEVGKSADLEWR